MKICLALSAVVMVVGCTGPDAPAEVADAMPAQSLRERLGAVAPVRLGVVARERAGTIGAARRAHGAWDGGPVQLGLESGSIVLHANREGALELRELALELSPITIPEDLVGQPAEFTQVKVALHEPTLVPTTWTGGDAVQGAVALELDMAWSLAFAGTELPIGAPDLPAVPATLVVTRTSAGVHAVLALREPGEIWSWAGLVQLADLTLEVTASETGE